MPYWLMKSEPDEFSIQDLEKFGVGRGDGAEKVVVLDLDHVVVVEADDAVGRALILDVDPSGHEVEQGLL